MTAYQQDNCQANRLALFVSMLLAVVMTLLIITPGNAANRASASAKPSATLMNTAKQTSDKAGQATRPIRDKWAVIIGIDKFKDKTIPPLQFASKDAADFAKFLVTSGNFAKDHVILLTNENATRDSIRDAIGGNWLPRRAAKDDLVLIFASTHGSPKELDVAGENFLVAYDSDPSNLYVTGIRFSDLAPEIKERTGCDRIVLLLDACNSGAATVGGKGLVRTGNFDVSSLAGEGQIIISSSAANQRSFESKRYDNGVFTKQLIAALQKESTGTTLTDAFNYLKDQVENEVRFDRKLEQTPVMRSKWSGGELILLAVPAQPRHVEPETTKAEERSSEQASNGQLSRHQSELTDQKIPKEALTPATPTTLFSNGNIYRVFNRPTTPTAFSVDRPTFITTITNYHWNNGRGHRPGTIKLIHQDGTVYGPWPAAGSPGQNNTPDAYWQCAVNSLIKPGLYVVVDSDPDTWSQNAPSGGAGMTEVKGLR